MNSSGSRAKAMKTMKTSLGTIVPKLPGSEAGNGKGTARQAVCTVFTTLALGLGAGAQAGLSGQWSNFSGNGKPDVGTTTTIAAGDAALAVTTRNNRTSQGGQAETLKNETLGGSSTDYSADVTGKPSLRWRFEYGSNTTCDGTATWRIGFGRQVWNPILHIDRLGGGKGGNFDTTVLTFPQPVDKRAGQTKFTYRSSPPRVFRFVPNKVTAPFDNECLPNDPNRSTACGSVRVNGSTTNLDIGLHHADGSNSGHDFACSTGDQIELILQAFSDVGDAPAGYGSVVHSIRDDRDNGVSKGGAGGALLLGAVNTDDTNTLSSPNADTDAGDDGVDVIPDFSTADAGAVRRWTVKVVNTTGADANLYGWIDFDRDGRFERGEMAHVVVPDGAATATLSWTFPAGIAAGKTFVRFRLSSETLTGPAGAAGDGEVEDYAITIREFPQAANKCLDTFYQTRQRGAGTNWKFDRLDFSTNPIGETPVQSGPGPHIQDLVAGKDSVNGIGFDIIDGYIYGAYWKTSNTGPFPTQIIRINPATGQYQLLGQPIAAGDFTLFGEPVKKGDPLNPNGVLISGDVDRNRRLFLGFPKRSDLVVVDLQNMTYSALPLITAGGQPRNLLANDISFNPQDGRLYAVRNNDDRLISINSSTGVMTAKVLNTSIPSVQGGAVFDQFNNLYSLVNNFHGKYHVHRVHVPDAKPVLQSVGSGSEAVRGNDAAGCILPRDYGDAPKSYATSRNQNGPSHVILDTNYDGTPELLMGKELDADLDGIPGAPADSDDKDRSPNDEEGITFHSFADGKNAFRVDAKVTGINVTKEDAMLCGWLDGAANGTVNGAFERNVTYTTVGEGTAAAGAGNEEVCVKVSKPGGSGYAIKYPATAGFNSAEAKCGTTGSNGAFSCTLTFWPNFTGQTTTTTYARLRLTSDASFFRNTSPSPTGPVTSGEVNDFRLLIRPTAATIGKVGLEAVEVAAFLDGLGAGGMDTAALLDLLAAWDPGAAAALSGADRAAILAALEQYLDPDGDGRVAVLGWDTLEERGTIGFYVERRDGAGAWTRVGKDLLPGLVTAPLGGEYRLADPAARSGGVYRYRLIEQEARGGTRTHGPYTLEMR